MAHVLDGHCSPVRCATLSSGLPSMVASAGEDGKVLVWQLGGQERVCMACLNAGGVAAVGFTADALPMTGGQDGTLKLWDVHRTELLASIPASPSLYPVVALAAGEGCVWSATADGVIRGWDPRTRNVLFQLWEHTGAVRSLAVLNGGRTLVSASEDGTCRVWEPARGDAACCKVIEQVHSQCPVACAHGRIAVQTQAGELCVYELAKDLGSPTVRISPHARRWGALALSSRGTVTTGADDGVLREWSGEGQCEREFISHGGAITSLCACSQGRVASGSSNGTVRVWDLEASHQLCMMQGHVGGVHMLQAAGNWILSTSCDEEFVRTWQLGMA